MAPIAIAAADAGDDACQQRLPVDCCAQSHLARCACQSRSIRCPPAKKKGRQIALPPPVRRQKMTYFRLVIAVRSAESLTMPVAPHQLELEADAGLIAVTLPGLAVRAVKSLVKALQSPLDRLVSE